MLGTIAVSATGALYAYRKLPGLRWWVDAVFDRVDSVIRKADEAHCVKVDPEPEKKPEEPKS